MLPARPLLPARRLARPPTLPALPARPACPAPPRPARSYAKVNITAFSVVPSRSGAVRTYEQRTALEMFSARITAVSLSGYLFFGRWVVLRVL